MHLFSFELHGELRLGAELGDGRRIDLQRACAAWLEARGTQRAQERAAFEIPNRLGEFLACGEAGQKAARHAIAWAAEAPVHGAGGRLAWELAPAAAGVRLLAASPQPRAVWVAQGNFHAAEERTAEAGETSLVPKAAVSIAADGDAVRLPPGAECVDWQGSLCVVIGATLEGAEPGEAHAAIGGYAVGNDITVRDWQLGEDDARTSRAPGPASVPCASLAKSYAGHGPVGPCLVTPDEVPDAAALRLETRVNGVVKQSAPLSALRLPIPHLLARLSQRTRLLPGDIVFTGSPPGGGALREPVERLAAGDLVEVEIPGVGLLRNPVVAAV